MQPNYSPDPSFSNGELNNESLRSVLSRLARIPLLGFVLRWLADVARLPSIHRHLALHIQTAERRLALVEAELTSLRGEASTQSQATHNRFELLAAETERFARAAAAQVSELESNARDNQARLAETFKIDLNAALTQIRDQTETLRGALEIVLKQVRDQTTALFANVQLHVDRLDNQQQTAHSSLSLAVDLLKLQYSETLVPIELSLSRARSELTDISSQLREYSALSGRWDQTSTFVEDIQSHFRSAHSLSDSELLPAVLRSLSNGIVTDSAPALPLATRPEPTSAAAPPPPQLPPRVSCYLGDHLLLTTAQRGLYLICSSQDLQITPQIVSEGVWEPINTLLYATLLSPGSSYLEVGANIGYFTTLAATYVGHHGSVTAFEPNPEAFCILEQNVRINRQTYLTTLVPLAVADSMGKRKMSVFTHNIASSTLSDLAPRLLDEMRESAVTIEVDVTTLDHEFKEGGKKFDFVKIDAEGSEPLIIEGATEFLQRNLTPDGILFMEWNPVAMSGLKADGQSMLSQLSALGFLAFKIEAGPLLAPVRDAHDLDNWRNADLVVTRSVDRLREKGVQIR